LLEVGVLISYWNSMRLRACFSWRRSSKHDAGREGSAPKRAMRPAVSRRRQIVWPPGEVVAEVWLFDPCDSLSPGACSTGEYRRPIFHTSTSAFLLSRGGARSGRFPLIVHNSRQGRTPPPGPTETKIFQLRVQGHSTASGRRAFVFCERERLHHPTNKHVACGAGWCGKRTNSSREYLSRLNTSNPERR